MGLNISRTETSFGLCYCLDLQIKAHHWSLQVMGCMFLPKIVKWWRHQYDVLLAAEVEHLLRLLDAADQGAGHRSSLKITHRK
jgi:hypothetical protein